MYARAHCDLDVEGHGLTMIWTHAVAVSPQLATARVEEVGLLRHPLGLPF